MNKFTYKLKKTKKGNVIIKDLKSRKLGVMFANGEYIIEEDLKDIDNCKWLDRVLDGKVKLDTDFEGAKVEALKMATDIDILPGKVVIKKRIVPKEKSTSKK